MDDLTYASANALAQAIRDKKLSSEELVDAHLRRIEAVNPKINAVAQLTAETARVQAKEADAALAAHPDLYERCGDLIALAIREGALALGSLQRPGYGYDVPIAFERRTPADRWMAPSV